MMGDFCFKYKKYGILFLGSLIVTSISPACRSGNFINIHQLVGKSDGDIQENDADVEGEDGDGQEEDADGQEEDADVEPPYICENYPPEAFASGSSGMYLIGDVIENLSFDTGNEASVELAGGDGKLDLCDLYRFSTENGGQYSSLLIWITTGWCTICSGEAPHLKGLQESATGDKTLFLAVVVEDDVKAQADADFARSYAERQRWNFPTVPGDVNKVIPLWKSEPSIGYPLHVFVDLRTMKLFARMSGGFTDASTVAYLKEPLDEIDYGGIWKPDGTRARAFDCNPTFGNEQEPNHYLYGQFMDSTTLPKTIDGTICSHIWRENYENDVDYVYFGNLQVGTIINFQMSRPQNSPANLFLQMGTFKGDIFANLPVNPESYALEHQWIITSQDEYYCAISDGRAYSQYVYGNQIPQDQQYSQGGPEYIYNATISQLTVEEIEQSISEDPPLDVGTTSLTLPTSGKVTFHSLDVVEGTSYTIVMTPTGDQFYPALVLYDPETESVLSSSLEVNRDPHQIDWTAPFSRRIWVVANYVAAFYLESAPPTYDISVTIN